jgi:hypothetical protein
MPTDEIRDEIRVEAVPTIATIPGRPLYAQLAEIASIQTVKMEARRVEAALIVGASLALARLRVVGGTYVGPDDLARVENELAHAAAALNRTEEPC